MKVNKQSPTLHFLIATAETTNKLSLRMKTALGHYKLDNSFPSSARMPFMSQPNIFIIVVKSSIITNYDVIYSKLFTV